MNQAMWTPMVPPTPAQLEKQHIRKHANFVGILLLAMLAAQFVVSFILGIVMFALMGEEGSVMDLLGGESTATLLLSMIIYLLYLLVPTLLVAGFARSRIDPFPLRRIGGGMILCLTFAGMGLAIFANVVTGFLAALMEGVGIPLPDLTDPTPPTVWGLLIGILQTAVLPALVEEFIFRGYIFGALRPHGEGIAIVLSAILFGLFHGNIIQVPFAILLGLPLAYVVSLTGSILPAVLLHFANNLMSVLLSWLPKRYPELSETTLNGGAFVVVVAVAVVALVALAFVTRGRPSSRSIGNGDSLYTVRERVGIVLGAPAMVVALVVLILTLLLSVVIV